MFAFIIFIKFYISINWCRHDYRAVWMLRAFIRERVRPSDFHKVETDSARRIDNSLWTNTWCGYCDYYTIPKDVQYDTKRRATAMGMYQKDSRFGRLLPLDEKSLKPKRLWKNFWDWNLSLVSTCFYLSYPI